MICRLLVALPSNHQKTGIDYDKNATKDETIAAGDFQGISYTYKTNRETKITQTPINKNNSQM